MRWSLASEGGERSASPKKSHRSSMDSSGTKKTVRMNRRVYYYLCIENADGYVLIAVYIFIYLYACYSHNSKSIKPNRMKFGGTIGYYPGTI